MRWGIGVGLWLSGATVGLFVGLHLPDRRDVELDAPTPAPYAERLTDAESRYVAELHARSDHFNTDVEWLIGLGRHVCHKISRVEVVRTLTGDAVSSGDLRVVVDAATSTLCPELRPRVTAYLAGGAAA